MHGFSVFFFKALSITVLTLELNTSWDKLSRFSSQPSLSCPFSQSFTPLFIPAFSRTPALTSTQNRKRLCEDSLHAQFQTEDERGTEKALLSEQGSSRGLWLPQTGDPGLGWWLSQAFKVCRSRWLISRQTAMNTETISLLQTIRFRPNWIRRPNSDEIV